MALASSSSRCACAPSPRAVLRPSALLSGARTAPHAAAQPRIASMAPAAAARRMLARAPAASNGVATADKSSSVPTPVVKIDNMSDPFATLVTVEFGDRLGELLDTITALKNLGLNIRRARLEQGGSGAGGAGGKRANTFYITDAETSEKVLKSARLEEIRMTIINNMLYYHPESAEALAAGESRVSTGGADAPARDGASPLGPRRRYVVPTTIEVSEARNGSCSLLKLTTADRPGLLVDVVRVLKDLNVNVVSAEIDTMGKLAQDEFFVTYHGEPLGPPMVQLVNNALQYYLSLAEVEREESY